MTPQIEKPQDEKEAVARLAYAVTQMNETLVAIHAQLKEMNLNLQQGSGPLRK
jgi:hypothetical protein